VDKPKDDRSGSSELSELTLSTGDASVHIRTIGPYRLLQLLGEGGMGEVWLAEQAEPIHRTVALKLIKAGMDTKAVVARFESERQALAMMDHPNIAKVLVLGESNRDSVVNAFRSGVKGLFCFADYPFRSLCKCIQSVHQGQVWANSQQLQFLLEIIAQVPSLRMVNARGGTILTPREEQVVALVADGLSNREVARELGLSEHTVKKYMFHIFDKLGISSRVELTLYAMSHGGARQAEWVAGGSE